MKANYLILLIMLTVAINVAVYGQASVTGHMAAEIVDAADARFEGQTDFSLNVENNHKLVELGKLNLTTAADMLCSVTLTNARVTNRDGESFNLETSTTHKDQFMTTDAHGEQALALTAITPDLPKGGRFVGNYTVVLAYN
ncbi:MAG: hypothetical protein M9901_09705 [Lentimicrobium sp.]|nr:hypothetical protein [Lentimicrobium sp.]